MVIFEANQHHNLQVPLQHLISHLIQSSLLEKCGNHMVTFLDLAVAKSLQSTRTVTDADADHHV